MPFEQRGDHASAHFHGDFYDGGHHYHQVVYQPDAVERNLNKLRPADMDASHREECLQGTRTALIGSIYDWTLDSDSKENLYLLYGLAGSGKSTLLTTLVNKLLPTRRLGAFVFFERDVLIRSDPTLVIRTIAYQIGIRHKPVGLAISACIDNDPDISRFPLRAQFLQLLVGPLSSIDQSSIQTIVIIIDALDECGTPRSRKLLLETLTDLIQHIPFIRLVVSSRPERDIRAYFAHNTHVRMHELDISSSSNTLDIARYLQHSMNQIRLNSVEMATLDNWPGDDVLQKLSQQASGLFVWASTASKFIDGYRPVSRLETVLRGKLGLGAEKALDALYQTALDSAGDWDDEIFVADFRTVMVVVLAVKTPLSSSAIDMLRAQDGQSCADTISHFSSVLQQTPTVRLLHPSFAEFLLTSSRCVNRTWCFDLPGCNRAVVASCIKCLHRFLKQNICDQPLSLTWEDQYLSDGLSYACLHWVGHVCEITIDVGVVMADVQLLVGVHLLHWLEAMAILKRLRDTPALLKRLICWVQYHSPQLSEFLRILRDGCRFVQHFVNDIEVLPLTLYCTALPSTPSETALYKAFHDPLIHPSLSCLSREKFWPSLMLTIQVHEKPFRSVAFSPDGTRIVSGSDDNTVCVWDATSGATLFPAFRGHKRAVSSVSFSPDGTRIVSGSFDETIRLWDAASGAQVLPAFRGHEGDVNSIAFSPDGGRIASGSDDRTVRVWDATSGSQVFTFRGHQAIVTSVKFSPDGTRIASGAFDDTVRVWDANSGAKVFPAFRGHEKAVKSVAFSPNGSRIVSGSYDMTIRVWDATSGVEVLSPFRGHKQAIHSVAFSPNGDCVISGSDDMTIRIWDIASGAEVFPASRGHDNIVYSVAFSPDGTRIVSGAWDGTIRIWDLTTDVQVHPRSRVHEGSVLSIAFSPDRARIASGSADNTIQLWEATSGAEALPALRGHKAAVLSVAFSPDGTRIASGSADWEIRVWDSISGVGLLSALRVPRHESIKSVAFSTDGTDIAANLRFGGIVTWDATSGQSLLSSSKSFARSNTEIFGVDGQWIVEEDTHIYIQKIPSTISSISCYASATDSHGRSLAIGTLGGQMFILRFPPRSQNV